MDLLAMQAGRALVRAAAGDDWPQARSAVTGLWSQACPEPEVRGVQAELDKLSRQVILARGSGDAGAEQALEGYWQVKLQQLLDTTPGVVSGLKRVLDQVLTPALLSPQQQTGPGRSPTPDDPAMRTTIIGQAAAGLTAAAAVIYGAGALTIALRLYFTRLSWEAVLGQLPRDLMLTTGFGEIILPAMIIGLLGAVLLNYLVNGSHGPAVSWLQLRVQRYLTASPSVAHFLMWLLVTALFSTLEPLISLHFYLSHRRNYFSPQVVIPAPAAMVTAGALCAAAVGIALILLPAPTAGGLGQGLCAPGRRKPGAKNTVTQTVRACPMLPSGEPVEAGHPCWGRRAARATGRGAARLLLGQSRQPEKPSSLGPRTWQAWVAILVGFAAIPGIATFNAVTLFPNSTACSAEFSSGRVMGSLIATNGGSAYMAEYNILEPKDVFIAVIPLSSVRLQTIGIAGDCHTLAHAPRVTMKPVSGATSSAATVNGLVYPSGEATTYQFSYGTTTSYGSMVPVPARYAGQGTSPVIVSATLTGLKPGTIYHYRIIATNATGAFVGPNEKFTTTLTTREQLDENIGVRCTLESHEPDGAHIARHGNVLAIGSAATSRRRPAAGGPRDLLPVPAGGPGRLPGRSGRVLLRCWRGQASPWRSWRPSAGLLQRPSSWHQSSRNS